MNNQERTIEFLKNLLGERLINYYNNEKHSSETSRHGRMWFPQSLKNEKYITPNGLLPKKDLIKMMEEYQKTNKEKVIDISMNPVGQWMGFTKCRCCGANLGNGGGGCTIEAEDGRKYSYSLTGGADHYIKHGIGLSLTSLFIHDTDRKIKFHITYVGGTKEEGQIKDFISTLKYDPAVLQAHIEKFNYLFELLTQPNATKDRPLIDKNKLIYQLETSINEQGTKNLINQNLNIALEKNGNINFFIGDAKELKYIYQYIKNKYHQQIDEAVETQAPKNKKPRI